MSTRNGDVVFLEDVLNESIEKTKAIIEENNHGIEDVDGVAKKDRYRRYFIYVP